MAKKDARSSIAHLLDVGFKVRAEFGTAQMTLGEILDLQQRGLIELDRAPDGYVDLFIDDQKIARGEVIAIGNHYGVRITELVEAVRERPRSATPPINNVRMGDVHPPRFSDMIADEPSDSEAASPSKVHESSIADAYEFPAIDGIEADGRRDEPTQGPRDREADTYSPRRSVPSPHRGSDDA